MSEQPARYSAAGNRILPNTFQHPNIFIDRLMYYLTPEENTVLTFATRRILGFQDNIGLRKDNISLSQFTDGQKSERDGHPLCLGCGMGATAIKTALDALEKYKILTPTTPKPDPRKGQEYWLQSNELAIDWDGLEQRLVEKRDKAIRRTRQARTQNPTYKGLVGQDSKKVSCRTRVKGLVGQGSRVLSDKNTKPIETNANPNPSSSTPTTAEIFTFYANNIELLTEFNSQVVGDLIDTYSAHWVMEALKETAAQGKHSVSYATGILKRWKADGFKVDTRRKTPPPAAPKQSNFERTKAIVENWMANAGEGAD